MKGKFLRIKVIVVFMVLFLIGSIQLNSNIQFYNTIEILNNNDLFFSLPYNDNSLIIHNNIVREGLLGVNKVNYDVKNLKGEGDSYIYNIFKVIGVDPSTDYNLDLNFKFLNNSVDDNEFISAGIVNYDLFKPNDYNYDNTTISTINITEEYEKGNSNKLILNPSNNYTLDIDFNTTNLNYFYFFIKVDASKLKEINYDIWQIKYNLEKRENDNRVKTESKN